MSQPAQHSFAEIMSQQEAWADAIAAAENEATTARPLFEQHSSDSLIFVACGSPYFLGRSAVALAVEWLGRQAAAVPASDILLYPQTVFARDDHPLMIAHSRSGETSETIGAARIVHARGGSLIGIGCEATSTLMRQAQSVVEIVAGREQSVAQTRSFAGMFVATVALIAELSDHPDAPALRAALKQLPTFGATFIPRARAEIGQFVADPSIERIFFLGSGVRYGLACEASLKMKEMSLTDAEAFHGPEFRHGPMSMVDDRTAIVGLIGNSAPEEELAVLREAAAYGARTLALVEHAPDDREGLDAVFAFESGLPPAARDVLYLPPVQLLACERAVAKGLDPDTSRNITVFVHRPTLAQLGG